MMCLDVMSVVALLIAGLSSAAHQDQSLPAYFPPTAASYRDTAIGFIHGAQYWINPDTTPESIDRDFKRIAQEDHLNSLRMPFWDVFYYTEGRVLTDADFRLVDACFDAADRYGIKLNPVLPQIRGWLDGTSDKPSIRQAYKEYIQTLVRRYKDKPALAMWTIDIEPSRSYKVEPCEETLARYRHWLPLRYIDEADFTVKNPGMESFAKAYPVKTRNAGPWRNYQAYNDWLTFTAWSLTDQTLFTSEAVKEIDPVHPTSCTPPDVLHNQIIENGRNMWWLADVVDYPSSQMHPHWHMETADMPADVLIAQACSIRKVYCSARGRNSYVGEVLCGPEIAFESTRFYTVTPEELLCTALTHLGEGVKGLYYWIWNPLKDAPISGAWPYRNPDGTPSARSRLLANFGRMVNTHNDVLYKMKPEPARIAIFDCLDAAIYMGRRSYYQPMSEWYVKNQYGFFKAMRNVGLGCDFIDERGLMGDALNQYDVIYVPFSMTMEKDIAARLTGFVRNGGVLIADTLTAFAPRTQAIYDEYPGAGMRDVFGIRPLLPQATWDGWSEVVKHNPETYFDRIQSQEPKQPYQPLYTPKGKKSPLVAWKMMENAELLTAETLYQDQSGRPVMTSNTYGKGLAVWTGTQLGYSAWPHDAPYERYEAIAGLIPAAIRQKQWSLTSSSNRVIARRLTHGEADLYVITNEGSKKTSFHLTCRPGHTPQELLWPQNQPWKTRLFTTEKIVGTLEPHGACVIYTRPVKQAQ